MAVALNKHRTKKVYGRRCYMNCVNKKPLIASIVFAAFASTFFVGCYYDRDDHWGYHRSRDSSYYDRDGYYDRGHSDRWSDYRDRDDSHRWSRVDPIDPMRS